MTTTPTTDSGPEPALDGIVVLDLCRFVAGPYTTMLLADAGADVIKVEPIAGEETRRLDPMLEVDGTSVSGYFLRLNRSKRSICVNLKDEAGRRLFLDLVAKADVVVENFRAGIMDNLRLGYDVLREANPGIVYCSISGYGHTAGPRRNDPAFAALAEMAAGVAGRGVGPEDPPIRVGAPLGDLYPGGLAVAGICMALLRRTRTGLGSHVDMAMYDAMVSLNENAIAMYTMTGAERTSDDAGNPRYAAPFGVFRTADGYITISVLGETVWERFCTAIGRPELAKDPQLSSGTRRADQMPGRLGEAVHTWLAGLTSRTAVETLVSHGVPAGRVRTAAEVVADPQTTLRVMLVEHESYRGNTVKVAGNPIRLEPGRPPDPGPAPAPGEHTNEVLAGLLGLTADKIGTLTSQGVIDQWSDSHDVRGGDR